MIIDEICAKSRALAKWTPSSGRPAPCLDLDYIREGAQLFGFDDIVNAIDDINKPELIDALENYIDANDYNQDLKRYIWRLIKF